MATATATSAAAEPPKLIKKASEVKTPTTATQTSFGCKHIKDFLTHARDKATEEYTRLIRSIRQEGNVSGSIYKSGSTPQVSPETTYMCIQCSAVTKARERHRKDHPFAVESREGFIFCHDCKDFVYDPTFEEIRSGNNKKRKHAALSADDKRLVSANSTVISCSAVGLRGLYNMGQTCFMSVILQALIHNPFIRTFYLSEGHRKEDCEREACTSCALDDIFSDFFGQEKHEGYGAVHMLQGCWKEGGSLAGYSQQDAHEFLGFILNSLHTAITDEEEGKSSRHCPCVIHQSFGGLLKSTVTCSGCKNTSTALDPFMDLSLDIRSTPVTKKKKLSLINATATSKEHLPMDLTECLDRFTSTETLSAEAGSYNCRHCSSPQEVKKKFSLSRIPPIIPIHLKRFSHSKSLKESSKIETKIRFPTSLDLSPYTTSSAARSKPPAPENDTLVNNTDRNADSDDAPDPAPPPPPPPPVYELSSVVVHKGKIDNGHYVSYARQGEDWFRFDDSMVVQVEEREVLRAEAYMLFYVVGEIAGVMA
ncbi:uncharacterized protein LTR77_003194 [Saxophila tyrrhenica]|uniref:Ubiquitin carboxyl-terminal hydrolase n=1 Tax=Saxophila tyrrhenica TaxID=1690608 RepID=A0AAV9PJV1_9PEZI|nr:hypothetical protein LTR77_003194 [Saxophila tyrrhenica]